MEKIIIKCEPMIGERSWELLKNPDRGLRMENHFNPFNCSGFPGTQRNIDGFELLKNNISKYAVESPQLTQLYIYLIDYYDRDLDQKAFTNLHRYFKLLQSYNLKVLLIFAYEYEENMLMGPTTEQILRHIDQLKPFLQQYRDMIHCLQAGFIGVWGEWHHSFYKHDRKTVLSAILDATPEDLFVQVRMVDFKNILDESDERRKRVGYADMYLVGFDHRWSISLFPGTPQYEQVHRECPYLLIDGEMPWGSDTSEVKDIDGFLMAKRLQKQHFTTLSLEHNYRESGYFADYAMRRWQKQMITEKNLIEKDLRFAPGWFKNGYGKNVPRPLFEYIRDHLGYLIMASEGSIKFEEGKISVEVKLINYGFAAPLAMKSINLVLFNAEGKIIKSNSFCNMEALQPEVPVYCRCEFPKVDIREGWGIGIQFVNSKGSPARLYNNLPFENGINKLLSFDSALFAQINKNSY